MPDDDLALAATWLTGRAFGRAHPHRHLKMGPALIRQALLKATALPLARYKPVSATQNESARTARLLLDEAALTPRAMALAEVAAFLERLATATGALERTAFLAVRFQNLHPVESASLVKILTGELRIGSKEGLLEDAVAEAFDQAAATVREAHMLTGDLGEVAVLAKSNRLHEARLTPARPGQGHARLPRGNRRGHLRTHGQRRGLAGGQIRRHPRPAPQREERPDNQEDVCIQGVVDDLGYLGNRSLYRIKLANDRIVQVSSQNRRRSVTRFLEWGDKVWISWTARSAVVLLD